MTTAFLIIVVLLIHSNSFICIWLRSTFICTYIRTYISLVSPQCLLTSSNSRRNNRKKRRRRRKTLSSIYICSELMHALQARRKSIRTQNVTRTHAPELSVPGNLTWRNHFEALRYDLYGSFDQHMVPLDRTMTFS